MLTLSGMTGLLSLADILITNDTGPLHLARAIKTPTIGIFRCGNAISGLQITRSIHRFLPSFSMNYPLCLSSKEFGKNDPGNCKHETSFVIDVTANEVKACLHELLAQTEQDQVELEIVA